MSMTGHDPAALRVVLLCSDEPQHRFLASELSRSFDLAGVIIEPGAAQRRSLLRHRRYRDWLFRLYHDWRQLATGRRRYRRAYFGSLCDDAAPPPASLVVDSINSPETGAMIRESRPDIVVVCATSLIEQSLIEQSPPMINVHGGCLPRYRGNHCIYFAYRAGDFEHVAATLHIVTSQLDAGDIIETIRPTIYPHDHDGHLYSRAVHVGIVRLLEVLHEHRPGDQIPCHPQPPGGRMYRNRNRTPRMDVSLWLRRRLARLSVPHQPSAASMSVDALRAPVVQDTLDPTYP